jgi:hypothetical protein
VRRYCHHQVGLYLLRAGDPAGLYGVYLELGPVFKAPQLKLLLEELVDLGLGVEVRSHGREHDLGLGPEARGH